MSWFSDHGLCINLWRPTWGPFKPDAYDLGRFAEEVNGYGHNIGAFGGFQDMKFSVACKLDRAEWLLQEALGAHVRVTSETDLPVWEGFVNQLDVAAGGMAMTYGPLIASANRAAVLYQVINTRTRPPTLGAKRRTPWANATTPQARYGILSKVFQMQGATLADATGLRDFIITTYMDPRVSKQLNLSGNVVTPSVSFNCLGYGTGRLNYIYDDITLTGAPTGKVNLSTKIISILAADPNALFSNQLITANTKQVTKVEQDSVDAYAGIQRLVALGDAAYRRYTFGVYEDRKVVYAMIPGAIEYLHVLADPAQQIKTIYEENVPPWEVRPGKWLSYKDFLVGRLPSASLYSDAPRVQFIERVSYTAPWSLNLEGGTVDRLDQRLAQLGLKGAA